MTRARWGRPRHSRRRVDRAGKTLSAPSPNIFEYNKALSVLGNWRASHSFPLNTIQMNLRQKAGTVDSDPLVAQRLKRVSSTIAKLELYPHISLSRMQDIGGCRAVVTGLEEVQALVRTFLESRHRHILHKQQDYIESPRDTGYRSVHLVYKYRSERNTLYNTLRIEVQIRSRLQHAWATAVETVGAFLGEPLKSGKGPPDWLRFFAVVSSAFAMEEGTTPVPGTPHGDDLVAEVRQRAGDLRVADKLEAYGVALKTTPHIDRPDAHYYLLSVDFDGKNLEIVSYRQGELARASRDYLRLEAKYRGRPERQTLLVGAESMSALRQAYPSYFLDTRLFLQHLRELTDE